MNDQRHLLYPLTQFYEERGTPLPVVERVSADAVPEPYQRLLVHTRDMTPTLVAFHGHDIRIRVLATHQDANDWSRQVVLELQDGMQTPVEFGAIVIHLGMFPLPASEDILFSKQPLGSILSEHGIEHSCHPTAFFRVQPDKLVATALGLSGDQWLYGRRNRMVDTCGNLLANIVEILPPTPNSQDAAT